MINIDMDIGGGMILRCNKELEYVSCTWEDLGFNKDHIAFLKAFRKLNVPGDWDHVDFLFAMFGYDTFWGMDPDYLRLEYIRSDGLLKDFRILKSEWDKKRFSSVRPEKHND
jgi:hypothetical protein